MTLEQAIRLLKWIADSRVFEGKPFYSDACKLGIAAMKQIRDMRAAIGVDHYTLLLGETEEDK